MLKTALKDIYSILIKNRKQDTIRFLAVSVLLAFFSAPIPYMFGYLVDHIIPSGDKSALLTIMGVMALLFLINTVLGYVNEKHALGMKKSLSVELSDKMLSGIFRLNYQERLQKHTGDLISRLTRDIEELHFIMPYGIARLIYSLLVSTIMIGVLVYLSWQLSLVLIILLPFAVVVYRVFNQKLWDHAIREADASSHKLTLLQEVISADAEIKSYGASKHFRKLAMSGVGHHLHEQYLRFMINTKVNTIIDFFPIIATVLIWYIASSMAIDGEITVGLIITYASTISIIIPALLETVTFIAEFPNQITVLERLQALTETPQENEKDYPKTSLLKSDISTISVVDLTFQYQPSKKPLYDNSSLSFNKGTSYLIKAPNGFGKSTLFALLSGQLKPQKGSIQINEQPIQYINDIHQYITILPQDIHLVSDTIRNNVTFGSKDFDDIEVLSILEKVGLGDWISAQENGLDTVLTQSNKQLSGGQVQRIGLARAFLRATPIILLDEPTNNLDNNAIQHLIAFFKSISKEIICLVISHDDRIYPYLDEVLDLSTITQLEKE